MPLFRQRPDLLSRFRAGERTALAEVYDTYAERVGELVTRGCQIARANGHTEGGLFVSAQDFLDVVHEVFVRAFSPAARNGYDGVRDYGPYLLMIARNTMVDWVRRRSHTTAVSSDWFADIASPDPRPDEATPWSAPGTLAIVERYLAGLPPDLRELHRLRYDGALSQEAAAQQMGISRQNLRTLEERLRRGLAREISGAETPVLPTRRTQNA
jgi:RNA polymerase sigma-70 factor (ECF subfamily)